MNLRGSFISVVERETLLSTTEIENLDLNIFYQSNICLNRENSATNSWQPPSFGVRTAALKVIWRGS